MPPSKDDATRAQPPDARVSSRNPGPVLRRYVEADDVDREVLVRTPGPAIRRLPGRRDDAVARRRAALQFVVVAAVCAQVVDAASRRDVIGIATCGGVRGGGAR